MRQADADADADAAKEAQGIVSTNSLLPGAVHAQNTTISAGHGALATLEAAGSFRAGSLDAGELGTAVGLTADGGTSLLSVVVGDKAAS